MDSGETDIISSLEGDGGVLKSLLVKGCLGFSGLENVDGPTKIQDDKDAQLAMLDGMENTAKAGLAEELTKAFPKGGKSKKRKGRESLDTSSGGGNGEGEVGGGGVSGFVEMLLDVEKGRLVVNGGGY